MTAGEPKTKFSDRSRPPVVLYDGVCNLCDATVRFILPRDPGARIQFASLQSRTAQDLMTRGGIAVSTVPESIVFLEEGKIYQESTAVLRLLGFLRFPWNLLKIFLLVPRPIRDVVYRLIARHRYRWFGKAETCLLPEPKWQDRFLDSSEL
jgi:predicted DCC family thiol-disulfide oxidoreductase YuxK